VSSYSITKPKDPENAFLLFSYFQKKGVTYTELLDKGLDSLIVKLTYDQLSYIDLKDNATSVVYQNERSVFFQLLL
jgi:hypothetical protein